MQLLFKSLDSLESLFVRIMDKIKKQFKPHSWYKITAFLSSKIGAVLISAFFMLVGLIIFYSFIFIFSFLEL